MACIKMPDLLKQSVKTLQRLVSGPRPYPLGPTPKRTLVGVLRTGSR